MPAPQQRPQAVAIDPSVRRRNRLVLLLLLMFIAFAFALSFRHVTREMKGAVLENGMPANSQNRLG
ncbi:hypothetical protein [Bosea sp. ANAM02]|uniref:hypothetical protein n=1 Tax=Bosea sp. ANAM02 TaxID=2020412 RepID=UPI00156396A6|nr:hypothetical protein [Bosea sp. ANAM02]